MNVLKETCRNTLLGASLVLCAGVSNDVLAQGGPAVAEGSVEGVVQLPHNGTVGQIAGRVLRDNGGPPLLMGARLYNGIDVNGAATEPGGGELSGWILNEAQEPLAFLVGTWRVVEQGVGQFEAVAFRGIQGPRFQFLDELGPNGLLMADFSFIEVLPEPDPGTRDTVGRQPLPEQRNSLHPTVPPFGPVTVTPGQQPDPDGRSTADRQPLPDQRGTLHPTIPPFGPVTVTPGQQPDPDDRSTADRQPLPEQRETLHRTTPPFGPVTGDVGKAASDLDDPAPQTDLDDPIPQSDLEDPLPQTDLDDPIRQTDLADENFDSVRGAGAERELAPATRSAERIGVFQGKVILGL